jgi:hypothetical protein
VTDQSSCGRDPLRIIWRDCEHCGRAFSQPDDPGRKRRFCADACKHAAYRARKRHAEARCRRRRPPAGPARSGAATHHDQAAHECARRRYEGLRAKAAATGFAEEAAACQAKVEQLRAKYGL